MGVALRKDIVVRLPMPLYQKAKKICDGEYKTFHGIHPRIDFGKD